MGFGLLFVGYFLTLSLELKGVNIPPDFIGYIIMFFACNKLRDYSGNFKKTAYALAILAPLAMGIFASELYAALSTGANVPFIAEIGLLKNIISIGMHYFLLKALADISTEVGRTKIAGKCRRNTYITLPVLIVLVVLSMPFISFPYKTEVYNIVSYVGVNFVIILNAIQIFSCYMWICYEGDEDMDMENATDPLAKLVTKMGKENAEYRLEKKKNKKNKKKK